MFEKKNKKTVLVLISHGKTFQACKEALEERGCRVIENPEAADEADFMVADSFFLSAGAIPWLGNENPILPFVWIAYGNESLAARWNHGEICYERIDTPWPDFQKSKRRICGWLQTTKAHFLFEQSPRKFGSGLWMDVIARTDAMLNMVAPAQRCA